jgi:hypothetical protein
MPSPTLPVGPLIAMMITAASDTIAAVRTTQSTVTAPRSDLMNADIFKNTVIPPNGNEILSTV